MIPMNAVAKPDSYGPENKRVGAGLYLGEPIGASVKGYVLSPLAVDFFMGWSLVDEAFMMMANATYDIIEIPTNARTFTLPVYAGVGVKVGFDQGGREDGDTMGGFRFPLGVSLQLNTNPIEIFTEVAPGFEFAPKIRADVTGGVGVRYYFF